MRWLFALVAIAWLAAGGLGTFLYVHRYWLYRGFPPPVTPAGIARGRTELVTFRSAALGQRRQYMVYLPPHYAAQAAHGRRFPVLYVLHAPPGRPDGVFLAGGIGVRADTLIARHRISPLLIVVPYGKDPAIHNDTEWADTRAGRYMGFVLDTVRDVDRRFATIPNRRDRAIAGLSEGGYGAINVALHNLGTFSVIQSWSGYYMQTPTAAFAGASPAQLWANSPADYVPAMRARIHRLGLHAWLYQGLTDFIAPWRIADFAVELHQAGGDVRFGYFRGGHDWGLWRAQLPRMLVDTSRWFAEPTRLAARHPGLERFGRPLPHAVWHRILFNPVRRCHDLHPPPGQHRPAYCGRLLRRLARERAQAMHNPVIRGLLAPALGLRRALAPRPGQ